MFHLIYIYISPQWGVGYILNNPVNALASNCTSHCNRFLSCIYGPAFLLKSTKDFPYFVEMCRVYGLPDNIKLPATYKHCQLIYIHHDTFLPPAHLAGQLTWWLTKQVFLVWVLSVFSEHILGICTSTLQTTRLCFLADWDLYMPLKMVIISPGNYRSIGYQVIIWSNKNVFQLNLTTRFREFESKDEAFLLSKMFGIVVCKLILRGQLVNTNAWHIIHVRHNYIFCCLTNFVIFHVLQLSNMRSHL